jgi:hypothetical protein
VLASLSDCYGLSDIYNFTLLLLLQIYDWLAAGAGAASDSDEPGDAPAE